jgi:TonB-dependent receptor
MCGFGGLLTMSSALAWGGEMLKPADVSAALVPASTRYNSVSNSSAVIRHEDLQTFDLGRIVVTSKRASLASAQVIKRDKLEIVDSVVAEDINKLPDYNVSDALQRITGIQIARDRGEGTGIAIRGLTQMETLLNGREIFTAGWGRNLDFADIPSEMLAAVDVYKTSSAQQIEGGIGGTIDLRTRRPFDFGAPQLLGTARVIHGDLVDASKPQLSLLASDRWDTADAGEFGALLNVSYQKRAWREDQKGTGNPVAITVAGQTVLAPNGATDTVTLGERERIGASTILQWRPTARLDMYAELHHAQFKTMQDGYQLFVTPSGTFDAGSVTLFPGTSDALGITWTNPAVVSWGSARDTTDRTTQVAAGGSWTGDTLTLKGDVSYTKSHNDLFYSVVTASGTAASLSQDVAGGSNLLAAPAFTSAGMVYASRPFDGELAAAQLDGEYQLAGDLLEAILAGLRFARRDATDAPGQVVFAANAPLANAAGLIITSPYTGYPVGDPAAARDVSAVHGTLGIATAIPGSNPLGIWTIREETLTGYLMARFKAEPLPLDGNLGLRIVRTRERVSGNQTAPSGGVLPIDSGHDYLDALPSVNLRYELAKALYLRAAASRTLTWVDFSQLSPSLTLNTVQHTGSAGNPELKPIRSDNWDLAVERYFDRTTSAHLTAFLKKVDGFVTTVSSPEVHDGETYQVSRPHNANPATVKGIELGYQQFYDFLPGWLGGLGLQAKYTYVDSETPNSSLGANVPLQNLSRNSVNLIGMYEKERLSARIANNWRDRFLTGVSNIAGVGALPVYTAGYGWLDASLAYRLDDQVSLSVDGLNLLRTVRRSYYGAGTHPQTTWTNDRQIGIAVTMKL